MSSVKDLLRGDVVDGSGTANYVSKWSDADTITNSVIYESSGNIGIGTNSPVNKLDVVGNINVNDTSFFRYNGDTGLIGSGTGISGGTSTQLGIRAANDILFATGGATERMRIDASGRVGIGTSSPAGKLDISASQADTSGITGALNITNNVSGNVVNAIQTAATTNACFYRAQQVSAGADDQYFFLGQTGNGAAITTNKVLITTNGAATFSGNVGIGGTPSYELDIQSTSPVLRIKNTTAPTAGGTSSLLFEGINNFSGVSQSFINSIQAGNSGATSLAFGTSGSVDATATERMRITSTGRVTISSADDPSTVVITNNRNVNGDAVMYNILGVNTHNTSSYFYVAQNGTVGNALFIYGNGNVVNVNGSYGSISDIKVKENVVDASPKLDDLLKVKVRNYNLIGDENKQIGVVAQELEEVFPSMIDESPDYEEVEVEVKDEEGNIVYKTEQVLVSEEVLDEDGNIIEEAVYETITTTEPEMTTERVETGTTTKSVKYSVFVPMLIKAVQELKAEIETLKSQK